MSDLTKESLERLAVIYATAAVVCDVKRMYEIGRELRRRDEAVGRLCKEVYLMALPLTKSKDKDNQTFGHEWMKLVEQCTPLAALEAK